MLMAQQQERHIKNLKLNQGILISISELKSTVLGDTREFSLKRLLTSLTVMVPFIILSTNSIKLRIKSNQVGQAAS